MSLQSLSKLLHQNQNQKQLLLLSQQSQRKQLVKCHLRNLQYKRKQHQLGLFVQKVQ
jgi:hypothetical protein